MVARSVRAGLHPQSGRGEPGVLKERCSQAVDTAVPQWGRALRAPAPPPPSLSPCVARQPHVAVPCGGGGGGSWLEGTSIHSTLDPGITYGLV